MRADQSPEIPTIKDVQYLVEHLDNLVERKPAHSSQLPFLFFREDQKDDTAQRFVIGYRTRLRDANKNWLIPHALISNRDSKKIADDDLALLDHITDNLQDFMPRSMGTLHLPNYCAIRAVLHMSLDPHADYDEQTSNVRHMLYKKYIQKRRWLQWMHGGLNEISIEQNARSWASLGFTLALKSIAVPYVWLVYGRHLQFGRRYQWFNDQITELGLGSHNFLRSSVHLAHISQSPESTAPIQRILISALLQDLQNAACPSFWSIRKSRRRTPFLLLFENVPATDTPSRRFIESFAAVRSDFPDNSVMVLAAVSGELPNIPDIEHYEDMEGAIHSMSHTQRHGSPINAQAMSIHMPASTEKDSTAKWWLFSHRVVIRRKSVQDYARPIYSLMTLLVLISGLSFGLWQHFHPEIAEADKYACSYTEKSYTDKNGVTTSEKVGIIGDKPDLKCSFSKNLESVEQQILKQNEEVQGKGFVTIMYVAPLDVPRDSKGNPKDGRQNQSGLWHLQGVARAQQSINEEAAGRENEGKLRVKILLANTGDKLAYGDDVAAQIGNFVHSPANKDWHVIGVAGINQSRKEARNIIDKLNTEYSLPVIGSSPTGDNMDEAGSASYMIAAPNSRQALIAATFAQVEPIVGEPGSLSRARDAVVIMDDDDEYSYNLADDFRKSFSTNGHAVTQMFNFSADANNDPNLPDGSLFSVDTQKLQIDATPDKIASALCGSNATFDPQKDIIFYASRSQEFDDVLYALQHSSCDGHITIVGGSDLGQFRDYKKYPIIQDHFYYAAFASANNPDNNELTAGPILTAYKESNTTGHFVNESDFARAYDSIFAFGLVANALSSDDNPITKETVKTFLSGSTPLEFAGVSGYNKLAGPEKVRVPKHKPVLIMKPNNYNVSVKMSCGWFGAFDDHSYSATKWGYEDGDMDQFDCPADAPS